MLSAELKNEIVTGSRQYRGLWEKTFIKQRQKRGKVPSHKQILVLNNNLSCLLVS